MKAFIPASLDPKRGCTLYMAKYGIYHDPGMQGWLNTGKSINIGKARWVVVEEGLRGISGNGKNTIKISINVIYHINRLKVEKLYDYIKICRKRHLTKSNIHSWFKNLLEN